MKDSVEFLEKKCEKNFVCANLSAALKSLVMQILGPYAFNFHKTHAFGL